MNKQNRKYITGLRAAVLLGVSAISMLNSVYALAQQTAAVQENWQPVSAEALVQLPANLIEKRIQQDFRMSPMANELLEIDQKVAASSQQIKALQNLLEGSQPNQMIDERVDLVQLKSGFLDLLQTGQQLRQAQLDSKMQVYQEVLASLYQQNNSEQNSKAYQLKLSQQEARQRMEKVMQQVDDTLMQGSDIEQSPYATEFASNLAKIEQLKEAIANHQSNLAANIDGDEVSTQEYIRQLLMQSSSEQSLLDQEALMLSYMAKIVALDAQSLEFAISEMQEQDALSAGPSTTPATSVSLFL